MHKHSDIEAQDQNETKLFWCVSKFCYKKMFPFIPRTLKQNQNVWCVSDFLKGTFLCIPKTLKRNQNVLVFQNFFSDSRTFLVTPKTLKPNQDVLKLFWGKT
jgi:hypothetical protein